MPYRRTPRWVSVAGIAAVVALILAGGVVLVMLVVSSLSAPTTLPAVAGGAGSANTCTGATWFDPTTASCVPKASCKGAEVYDQKTNTCAVPGPQLNGIEPNSGLATGGTPVRLVGGNFDPTATVLIDGVPATDVTVVNDTTITASTPGSKNLYPVDVTVTNPQGPPATLDNAFTYVKPAIQRLTGINPSKGSKLGGEAVIVRGVGFTADTKVAFGGRAASSVELLNPTTLRVITPIGDGGPVTVNIDVPGASDYAAEDAFTYVNAVPRVVMAIRPLKGGMAGGMKVTIVGTGFDKNADVAIGGNPAKKVKVVSSTKITAVTPKGVLGPANVAVRNPGLPAAILTDGFEYVVAPEIESITPAEGSTAGDTKVTIVGSGFLKDVEVTIGGQPATEVKLVSDSKITAVTPAGKAGKANVVVTNPDQPAATAKKAFTYVKEPKQQDPAADLPRCKPFTVPSATTPAGTTLPLSAAQLFAGRIAITKPRLVSAALTGSTGDVGDIAWQGSPPLITWVPPDTAGAAGTITYGYQATSCTGTATASIAVSTN